MSGVSSGSRRATIVLTVVLALLLAPTATAMAAVDMFIKIDDIKGESVEVGHEGEIEVLSWSWGATNAAPQAPGAGRQRSSPTLGDVVVVKLLDKSTPKLLERLATGQLIPSAVLTQRAPDGEGGGHEYLKITLNDVLVTSYSVSSGGDRPTESFSLNYSRVLVEYFTQGADGGTGERFSFGWDLKKNKSI